MANINVSIDGKGNLQCPDINGALGESVTWVPDPTTISSIASITTSIGTFNPAPSARNNWTGTLATDGTLPSGGTGLDYTITVNPQNSASGQKTKTPKISVNPPEEKTKKEEALHATESYGK
jgi:hypothetical protein